MSVPWTIVGIAAYAGLLAFVLALLRVSADGEGEPARARVALPPLAAAPPEPGVEATSHWLGLRTADVRSTARVERVAIAVRDPEDLETWVIEACAGVEGLCGVLVAGPDGSGGDRPPPAALLRGGTEGRPWRVAAIPIADLGELVVATRRARGLGGRDLELLEGFAAMLARRLGAGRTDWRSRGSSVA